MRPRTAPQSIVTAAVVLAIASTLAACSGSPTTAPASGGTTVALGTNDPAQGDCLTNTSEAATSVGSVVLSVTASSFEAQIELQGGAPSTTYGVYLQQVPGSCPQLSANGGALTTDSAGHGSATATVPRLSTATTFFVQLVPAGPGQAQYTSDRISAGS